MKTWQLFKTWLKIVKIARNDKVSINSVKQKLCDIDDSLQMSQFDNFTNMINANLFFWYVSLIAVGTLAMVFQLSTPSSFYRSLGRKPRRFIFVDECRISNKFNILQINNKY